jgi:hypothetical protein
MKPGVFICELRNQRKVTAVETLTCTRQTEETLNKGCLPEKMMTTVSGTGKEL